MKQLAGVFLFTTIVFCFSKCNQQQQLAEASNGKTAAAPPPKTRTKPAAVAFHLERTDSLLAGVHTEKQMEILLSVNRTDSAHLPQMDSAIVPGDLSGDREFYLPFPVSVPALKDVKKIILFSYPVQAFAAYEMGELVYAGQTNMGRKKDPTPTGLFFTNWKAEETTSTFNDEWNLRWNFNIENKLGVGFHQYSMPGYPASHSCMRLVEKDAHYLYSFANQWILSKNDSLLAKGTPVIVFGNYDFGAPKPWLQLASNPRALDIPAEAIEQEASPYLKEILTAQQQRDSVENAQLAAK